MSKLKREPTVHTAKTTGKYYSYKGKNEYYYELLKQSYASIVPSCKRVLEVGRGTGKILAHLYPKYGLVVDITNKKRVDILKKKQLKAQFKIGDAEQQEATEPFDYIILPDAVEHLEDIWQTFNDLKKISAKNTRLCLSFTSRLWDPILGAAEKLKLKMPEELHNNISLDDLVNLLEACGYKVESTGHWILLPKKIPVLSDIINKYGPKVPYLKKLSLVQYIIAKPQPKEPKKQNLSCSVIIPCYNEEGNIKEAVYRIPKLGQNTEIIVVDDGSKDRTKGIVERIMKDMKNVKLVSYSPNKGKGIAVKKGFDAATGDVLMILDADMAVPPEELTNFYDLFTSGHAKFVNGTRMVYQMEDQAMRWLHVIGNKFFSAGFTWVLGQRITDTLCGTKAILKRDYNRIDMSNDQWGDFSLLFGASRLRLKIVEMPVHYKKRTKGESKMRTFKHGWLLSKVLLLGVVKVKLLKTKLF